MQVVFVYPNPRAQLAADVAAGEAPDTGLLGQNHLPALGIHARAHEPALRRRERFGGVRHRLTWNLREIVLPWELGDADAALTPLSNIFPLAARLRGAPIVVILNWGLLTTWRRASRPRRRVLRTALRRAQVACVARGQRDALVAEAGLPQEAVHVVEIGVDERFFRPEPSSGDGYVLAVGKDLARDYGTLAAAASRLDVAVRIVTSPHNVAGIALPRNVEVLHGVTWAELRRLYAGAACVVLPLRRPEYRWGTEGSGLTTLLEALAMGRPIVATERAVFEDYVRPDESYLPVPAEDPAALAAAVERVVADPSLGERLGARARALVEERFTTRHFAARLADLLRRVAS